VELRQFMGKDNILFHSIINPASLMATGQQWIRPAHLSVTEYLKYEGGKFSKSHSIGVFGDQCKQTGISVDCWRYYLLRIRPESFDSEFSWSDFAQKCNKDLLNCIGNLFQRVLKYSFKTYGPAILPLTETDLSFEEQHVLEEFNSKFKQFITAMEKTQLMQGTLLIGGFADCLNQYVGKTEFWNSHRYDKLNVGNS
jgi:methionyl-tRNA synthetase